MRRIFKINEHQYRLLEKEVVNQIFRDDKPVRLDESLGISDEVVRVAQDLYNKANERIDELIKNGKVKVTVDIGDLKNVAFYIENTGSDEGRSLYLKGGVYSYVVICVSLKDGVIDWKKFFDTAQHEINHIYEQQKTNKPYRPLTSIPINQNIYSNNIYKRCLAIIAYASDVFEQDGFVNGMYAYIKRRYENGEMPIAVEDIDAYKQLAKLYHAKNFLLTHRFSKEMENALSEYKMCGWDFKKLKSRAFNGIKTLENKIKRTLKKCEYDGFGKSEDIVKGENKFFQWLHKDNISYDMI